MFETRRSRSSKSRSRSLGAAVVQAFAVASQMALVASPEVDEWMRRELSGSSTDRRRPDGD